jgi:hypothetical protein
MKSWDNVYSCLDLIMLTIVRYEVLSAVNINIVVLYSMVDGYKCLAESVALFFYPEGGSSTFL